MRFQYALDVLNEDGRSLEHAVVTPDWSAAAEWVHFEGIRAGSLPPETRAGVPIVEPVWIASGAPYVAALRVTVAASNGASATRDVPRAYLGALADALANRLVQRGLLTAGESFHWTVRAFASDGPSIFGHAERDPSGVAVDAGTDELGVAPLARPLPVDDASLAAFVASSATVADRDDAPASFPVFIPRDVLAETVEVARASPDVETGGALVGKLHRDRHGDGGGDLFLEITAQIPALHTVGTATRLTFTPCTWTAVNAELALRPRGEMLCGWWHFHPSWCRIRGCPPERRRTCAAGHPFFSAEDVHLHAACFVAGHHVALLISDGAEASGLSASLYGWSQGVVAPRGFHVLGKGDDRHAENLTR